MEKATTDKVLELGGRNSRVVQKEGLYGGRNYPIKGFRLLTY